MKQIETKITKFFYSDELNQKKFDVIYEKAELIRDFKNQISDEIYKNPSKYLDFSKFDMIKYFNTKIDKLNGQDIQNAITDVYTMYSNYFDVINQKTTFKRKNKKSSLLNMTMTFLVKYGHDGISSKLVIPKNDKKKKVFYEEIIRFCNKYGENRLLKLAYSKRKNIIKNNLNKIWFNELSFRTVNRIKSDLFDYNSNFQSKFDGFLTINGYDSYKRLHIPTQFNKKYHGNKSNYERNTKIKNPSQSYQIKIIDKNKKKVRIAYLIDHVEEIPDNNYDYLGVDVNSKHNLFATPIGNIDYNRDLINKYVKFLQKIDNRKSKLLSKRRASDMKKWRARINDEVRHRMVDLIKLAKANGRNHLILEDLELRSKLRSKSAEFDINNGRLSRLLGLSSIKNELIQIAHRHGISVSLVQPEFSSKTCFECGNIVPQNRKNQEEFRCVSCGYEDDADRNSSNNLQWRIESDVLKQSLLEMNEFHEYRPKDDKININMGFIKDCIQHSYSVH